MRNAILLENNIVITTDNAGGIGEKEHDLVRVSDEQTAYFAARVALLEQWASKAIPTAILIQNFSGEKSWERYVRGVAKVFEEINCPLPEIKGSTETNMSLMQSAVAITIIGRREKKSLVENLDWYIYGQPLVGEEVLLNPNGVASLKKIYKALQEGIIEQIWPVGSKGIEYEVKHMLKRDDLHIQSEVNVKKSAGPSTAVLIAVKKEQCKIVREFLEENLYEIRFN